MTSDRLTFLYRRYGAVIHARCEAILQDQAAAEDATQETFIRVLRHLDRAPTDREALFWIYRIATNHCLNGLPAGLSRRRRGNRGRPQALEHEGLDAVPPLRADAHRRSARGRGRLLADGR